MVDTQLCARFPDLFVWHCSYHHLDLAVGDVLKEVSALNHFKTFFDKLHTLYHASPKSQRIGSVCTECWAASSSHRTWLRWVASSERTVKAVRGNYRVLQVHFSNAADDVTRDSVQRAKYKRHHDVLTSVPFVFNLGLRYDGPNRTR